jgi:hypothetical protein
MKKDLSILAAVFRQYDQDDRKGNLPGTHKKLLITSETVHKIAAALGYFWPEASTRNQTGTPVKPNRSS